MTINKNRHLTYLALLCAMAITLNLLESMYIGPIIGVLRIGLANIIALITIRLMGIKETIIVNVMRVVIGNLLRGTIFGSTFWISSGGVFLSTILLILLDYFHSSLLFMAVFSSLAHSLGQVLVVMAFYKQPAMLTLLPYLILGSIPTGLLTGSVASLVLKHIKPLKVPRGTRG